MSALYLCYQSICEPLTQTQVVSYLEGLARAGYQILLLTFEPRRLPEEEIKKWRKGLAAKGIVWHWLRYHKRPTLPATAWDIAIGIIRSCGLIRAHRIKIVHARAHVPGVMALVLKYLTRVKVLFDIRGFMAEEYVDGKVWPENGFLFRLVKKLERWIIQVADGIVVLTYAAKAELLGWYAIELENKHIKVIPCCVDMRPAPSDAIRSLNFAAPSDKVTLAYAGKLGGWYPISPLVSFLQVASTTIPNLHLQVWTQSDSTELSKEVERLDLRDRVQIGSAAPELLQSLLGTANAGICFYVRNRSRSCCSPTKVPEYLAAGLPVICSAGIGDTDQHLVSTESDQAPAGVLIKEFTPGAYRHGALQLQKLLADPQTPVRCQAVARKYFDLVTIGWREYISLYQLMNPDGICESTYNPLVQNSL